MFEKQNSEFAAQKVNFASQSPRFNYRAQIYV